MTLNQHFYAIVSQLVVRELQLFEKGEVHAHKGNNATVGDWVTEQT